MLHHHLQVTMPFQHVVVTCRHFLCRQGSNRHCQECADCLKRSDPAIARQQRRFIDTGFAIEWDAVPDPEPYGRTDSVAPSLYLISFVKALKFARNPLSARPTDNGRSSSKNVIKWSSSSDPSHHGHALETRADFYGRRRSRSYNRPPSRRQIPPLEGS